MNYAKELVNYGKEKKWPVNWSLVPGYIAEATCLLIRKYNVIDASRINTIFSEIDTLLEKGD